MKEETIKKIITLVRKYFEGKEDKGGHPYEQHLNRVAARVLDEKHKMKYVAYSINEVHEIIDYDRAAIVAYLHDILEDTDCTIEELREAGCDDIMIDAVLAITRKEDEDSYSDFIKRVKKNPIARLVKTFDLEDNMDIKRLEKVGDYELKRLQKYWYSWRYITDKISEEEYDKIKGWK